MNSIWNSRGGGRRVGVFGDKNSGEDDLVNALKQLQPRHLGDGYCLQCLCRRCICIQSQEGKASENDEFEEAALAELRAQLKPGQVTLILLFMGGSD